jgi:hypothetical protein
MARSKKGFDFIPLVVLAGAGALVYLSGKSGGKEAVKKSPTQPTGTTPPPGPRPQTLKPPPKISGSVPTQEAQVESASYSDLQSLGYSISNPVEAIRKFQEDYNTYKSASALSVDGAWGPKTSAALEDVFASFPDQQSWMQALAPATSAEYDFDRDYALAELGYMESDAAENMYRFQIDYLNHTQQPQTEGLAIYSWSLEWENALRWTYETLRDLWSGLVVQGVTWAEVADQVAAEQESEYDPSEDWEIFADYDDGTSGGVHDHLRIGRADWYKDSSVDLEVQKGRDAVYNMEWEDLNALVAVASDRLASGMDGDPWHDPQETSVLPGNVLLGNILTGRKHWVSGPEYDTLDHFHPALVYSGNIMELVRTGTTALQSKRGQEIADKGSEEWHRHKILMKYLPSLDANA